MYRLGISPSFRSFSPSGVLTFVFVGYSHNYLKICDFRLKFVYLLRHLTKYWNPDKTGIL